MPKHKPDSGLFTTVKRFGPTQQVREQLLNAIQSGVLAPGDPLPPERELSETFGVSRVSVRQALAALEAMELVRISHGKGAFVSESIENRYNDRVRTFIALHRDGLIELTDVRGALDELAAAQVAASADDSAVSKIRSACDAFSSAVERGDLAAAPALDLEFHLAIADHSEGTLLRRLIQELNTLLTESRAATFSHEGQLTHSAAEHRAITDAIAAHDPDAARLAARKHMGRISAWLRTTGVADFGSSG